MWKFDKCKACPPGFPDFEGLVLASQLVMATADKYEPEVYQHCLLTLQKVIEIKSQGDEKAKTELLSKFRSLGASMKQAASVAQRSVLPFFIRTHYEALSMSINLESCKILDTKLSLAVMESMATSLISLKESTEKNELGALFDEEKVNEYICKLLFIVLALI